MPAQLVLSRGGCMCHLLQGLVQQTPTNWTQFAPIVVTQLPYLAQHPITSPSGRAVWKVQTVNNANNEDHVDVVVCRFPEPDGLQGIPDGTVTAYRCAIGAHRMLALQPAACMREARPCMLWVHVLSLSTHCMQGVDIHLDAHALQRPLRHPGLRLCAQSAGGGQQDVLCGGQRL
jgi:hypothetical protein